MSFLKHQLYVYKIARRFACLHLAFYFIINVYCAIHAHIPQQLLSNYIYELMRIKLKIQTLKRAIQSVKLLFYNTYNSLRCYGQLKIYIILTIKHGVGDIFSRGIFISSIYSLEATWRNFSSINKASH